MRVAPQSLRDCGATPAPLSRTAVRRPFGTAYNCPLGKIQKNFFRFAKFFWTSPSGAGVSGQATNDINAKEEMTIKNENITFDKLDRNDKIPYDLLLLADPSKYLIDEYLKQSDVFTARQNNETIGVIVLFPLTTETVEIKNVAVKPEFQGKGIGSYLIENVVKVASSNRQKSICIGTANSSVGQLYLYQKLGFEITNIKRHFFTDNYAEPIYENGIQAKHMLVLTRQLNDKRKN
ncbi:MAG: GNAT family N-acetyltransferase [Saprospiraceae bacterium]|nr:GNAT family N-acetyltransferase [Saprospiraceae bacterium]